MNILFRIVLRNHLAQTAIEMAEQGDYSEVRSVLQCTEYKCVCMYVGMCICTYVHMCACM